MQPNVFYQNPEKVSSLLFFKLCSQGKVTANAFGKTEKEEPR